jgi:xanthine/uracil permease
MNGITPPIILESAAGFSISTSQYLISTSLIVSALLSALQITRSYLCGLNGMLACLCTVTPRSTFAQNTSVVALTRCANRKAGYAVCFFLAVMGIFSKFAAALVAFPASVLGGTTTFLFSSVAISGIRSPQPCRSHVAPVSS